MIENKGTSLKNIAVEWAEKRDANIRAETFVSSDATRYLNYGISHLNPSSTNFNIMILHRNRYKR
jgi:hypothetical protein